MINELEFLVETPVGSKDNPDGLDSSERTSSRKILRHVLEY